MAGSGSPAGPGIGDSSHPLQPSRGLSWLATLRPDTDNTRCRPRRSVSRGYGRWQKELVRAVGGVHTATVAGVVRTCVPEPDRSDYTAARRAARTLALEETLVALYVYACQRCGQVQDHEPERCCGVVRSSLAVTRPGRTLPHLAPPPTGTRCPPWIGVSVASRLPSPSPPGRLATPSIDDLVRPALQRAYERALDGEAEVTLRDAAALLRLEREIDREAARQAAGTIAQWEATLQEVLWAARRHLGEHWKPFVADIRTNQHLAAMWGLPAKADRARQFPGPGRSITRVTAAAAHRLPLDVRAPLGQAQSADMSGLDAAAECMQTLDAPQVCWLTRQPSAPATVGKRIPSRSATCTYSAGVIEDHQALRAV